MRGYHKCSLDEAVQLAAFTYRVLYEDDASYLDDRKYVLSRAEWQNIVRCICGVS